MGFDAADFFFFFYFGKKFLWTRSSSFNYQLNQKQHIATCVKIVVLWTCSRNQHCQTSFNFVLSPGALQLKGGRPKNRDVLLLPTPWAVKDNAGSICASHVQSALSLKVTEIPHNTFWVALKTALHIIHFSWGQKDVSAKDISPGGQARPQWG